MGYEQPNFDPPKQLDSKGEKGIEFGLARPEESRDIYEVKKMSWLATYTAPEYDLTEEDI